MGLYLLRAMSLTCVLLIHVTSFLCISLLFFCVTEKGQDKILLLDKMTIKNVFAALCFDLCLCCAVHSFAPEHCGKAAGPGFLRVLLHAGSAYGRTSFWPGYSPQLYQCWGGGLSGFLKLFVVLALSRFKNRENRMSLKYVPANNWLCFSLGRHFPDSYLQPDCHHHRTRGGTWWRNVRFCFYLPGTFKLNSKLYAVLILIFPLVNIRLFLNQSSSDNHNTCQNL